jgi:2-polyprenyl-6-methoxyphenol hydroxylase-like FAD-dependent oxidoreductase
MTPRSLSVRCCIVGGGPAGIMLGYLLARAGHSVAVLEKHGDFLRDFRGDTVHPSTMTMLDELGLLERFLARPHSEVTELRGTIGRDLITLADFTKLPAKTKFLAFMPQWDFLDFLSGEAGVYPGFHLLMKTAATSVVREHGRVIGVIATDAGGELTINADVVVATDGRHSTMREAIGLRPHTFGAPMDVLWMRLSRKESDTASALGYIGAGAVFVTINRNDYWQCGYVIPKGTLEQLRAGGLEELHRKILLAAPFLSDRINEIASWDDVKLLEVAVDRLDTWFVPGLLFIGDAAHAMSPIGGVGINLAIQDAVATGNILSEALDQPGPVGDETLARVQLRREDPTKKTQALQLFIQRNVITRVLAMKAPPTRAPWLIRAITSVRPMRQIPARAIGIGFRPEHIAPRILVTPESTT